MDEDSKLKPSVSAPSSSFDPKHDRLPSVELTTCKVWAPSPAKSSLIPRPVSLSTDSALLVEELGRGRPSDQPADGDPEEDSRLSLTHEKSFARYHGKYQSYEEMLANMDDSDPFQGQPPSPKQDRSEAYKTGQDGSSPLRTSHHRVRLNEKQTSQSEPRPRRKKKKRTHETPQVANKEEEAEDKGQLNGTYTVKHHNPAYDNAQLRRRESTGTFTVDRTDSRTKLVHEEKGETRPSLVDVNTHNAQHHHVQQQQQLALQAHPPTDASHIKKVRIDHREQAHISSGIEESEVDNTRYLTRQQTEMENLRGYNSLQRMNAVQQFVERNIVHRQCKVYMKDPKSQDVLCQCGRDREWHLEVGATMLTDQSQEKWSPEQHTKEIPPDSYGTICFNGFGQEASRAAPYIRVDYKTPLETVWSLLSDYWSMPPPKLIISVTGGAKRFFMKNRLKSSFKRGLVNAATTTGAWIITGGTNAGVMEFVGEAVRDYMLTSGASEQKVVALGIAVWGIVDNRENLTGDDKKGCFPANYDIDDLSPKHIRGVSPLDHNHTHFILVDNGTEKKFGAEIKLRTSLEQYISAKMETGVARNQSVHVPVVLLVLEGGENTLETAVQSALQKTPVVVIQGSGRAADYIAYAYKQSKSKDGNEDKSVEPPRFDAELHVRAGYMFDWSREKDPDVKESKIKKCVTNVKTLLTERRLVTVFTLDDVDTTNEIDQAILYALLKANQSDAMCQLNLALAWNRCDVARQEIFSMENRARWQKMYMYDAMFTALVQDRVDFVQLFVDNGVELGRFLTVRRLRDLYDNVVNDRYSGNSSDLLRHLLQQMQQSYKSCMTCCRREEWEEDLPNLLEYVGQVINHLIGDQHQDLYKGNEFVVHDEKAHLPPGQEGFGAHAEYGYTNSGFADDSMMTARSTVPGRITKRKSTKNQERDFKLPERELFMWAVLLNRKAMALFMWKNGRDHIGGALTGSALLKALATEADKEEELDLSADLTNNSQEFQNLAVGVLNECYQREKVMSHQLLTRELTTWGNSTLLTIADASEHMDFMGHSCCQTQLNKIWRGRMALYTSIWKILGSLIFLPFILPTIKFSTAEQVSKPAPSAGASSTGDPPPGSTHNQVVPVSGDHDSPSEYTVTENGEEYVQSPPRRQKSKKRGVRHKLFKVDVCRCCTTKDSSINLFQAIYFYHTAPLVKFCYHTVSYLVFLGLYSYFMLTDLRPTDEPNSPSYFEYIVWGWAGTMFIEEMRQVWTRDPTSLRNKLSGYFSDVWNQFDIVVYLLLILSIILRYTLFGSNFDWARNFYTLTLCLFYLRFMHTFFVERNIGPKVIMIRRMLTDLAFFILLLATFLVAEGVASQALRFPNAPATWEILRAVVAQPYWQLYGELFLEDMEGDTSGSNCESNRTIWATEKNVERCPENSWLAMVIFAFYMMMTNILLLNLLIAMFSYTFEKVQENSEKVWRFYRYGLVHEFFEKPTLAPPLIILSHILRLIKLIVRKCRGITKVNNDFKQELTKEENNKLTAFERAGMENHLLCMHICDREHIDAKVTSAGERIEKIIEDMEQLREQVTAYSSDPLSSHQEPLLTIEAPPTSRYDPKDDLSTMQTRIGGLEYQLTAQGEQMGQMLLLLRDLSQVGGHPPQPLGPAMGAPGHPQHPRSAYYAPHSHPQIEIQDYALGNTDA